MGNELHSQKKAIAPPDRPNAINTGLTPSFSPIQRKAGGKGAIDVQVQLGRAEQFGHHLSQFQVHPAPLQRQSLLIQQQVVEEEQKRDKEHEDQIQRKEDDLAPLLQKIAMPDLSPQDSGHPLPQNVQTKMEKSFGTSFSDVRIHEGPQAKSVGALAYTQGSRIHFAPGQYSPESPSGQALLGHELTHVVQQRAGRVPVSSNAGGVPINADTHLEQEADDMGAKAARGETAIVPGGASSSISLKREEPMQHSKQLVQFFLVKLLVNALLKPALDLLFGDMGGGGGGGGGGGAAEGGGGGADR